MSQQQQRQAQKPPQLGSCERDVNNKSHLVEATAVNNGMASGNISVCKNPKTVTNQMSGSKRISFTDLHHGGK